MAGSNDEEGATVPPRSEANGTQRAEAPRGRLFDDVPLNTTPKSIAAARDDERLFDTETRRVAVANDATPEYLDSPPVERPNERRSRLSLILGLTVLAALIAAIVGVWYVTTHTADPLTGLREAENELRTAEQNAAGELADTLHKAQLAERPAKTLNDSVGILSGVVDETARQDAGAAAAASLNAISAAQTLTMPSLYQRTATEDSDDAEIAAALSEIETRSESLKALADNARQAGETLDATSKAVTASSEALVTAAVTAADTAMAQDVPAADSPLRPYAKQILDAISQQRAGETLGLEYMPLLAEVLRAFALEQAGLG